MIAALLGVLGLIVAGLFAVAWALLFVAALVLRVTFVVVGEFLEWVWKALTRY